MKSFVTDRIRSERTLKKQPILIVSLSSVTVRNSLNLPGGIQVMGGVEELC
jgi:hypothetical protein